MKIENKIDQLLSAKMDGYRAEPPANVWDSIQADLQTTGFSNVAEPASNTIISAAKSISTFTKVVMVAGTLSVGSIAYYFLSEETVVQPITEITKEATTASIGLNQKDEMEVQSLDKKKEVAQNKSIALESSNKTTQDLKPTSIESETQHAPVQTNVGTIEDLISKLESPKESNKNEQLPGSKENEALSRPANETEESLELLNEVQNNADFTENRQPKFYNVISPNGDGKNDSWFVEIEEIAEYHLSIYDFKGQLVFESDKVNEHWNGENTRTGELCSTGKFAFVLNYRYKNETKMNTNQGLIMLFR